jgi:hypothetical protein
MKTQVNFSDFCDAWRAHDRNNSFSYAGKRALFDWLEEYEADTGQEQELDIVALDCDFVEYENLADFHNDYDKEDYPTENDISDNTMLIPVEGDGFIIQNF